MDESLSMRDAKHRLNSTQVHDIESRTRSKTPSGRTNKGNLKGAEGDHVSDSQRRNPIQGRHDENVAIRSDTSGQQASRASNWAAANDPEADQHGSIEQRTNADGAPGGDQIQFI